MTENIAIWNALKRPPTSALRTINFGALKGKSDIDPMWRVQAMTEQFGPCGIGWKFEIKKVWSEPAPGDQMFAFAEVLVYIKVGELSWSDPVPGVGGNMLIKKAKDYLNANDEGYKMAVTDAIGTALKMLGVAADIYMGKFDGSKYKDDDPPKKTRPKVDPKAAENEYIEMIKAAGISVEDGLAYRNELAANAKIPPADLTFRANQNKTDFIEALKMWIGDRHQVGD